MQGSNFIEIFFQVCLLENFFNLQLVYFIFDKLLDILTVSDKRVVHFLPNKLCIFNTAHGIVSYQFENLVDVW